MAKLTIYTQAYNTEKYIEQCIESVLTQTLSDFEYIIVDNGSTDNTKNILKKYAEIDKRIKLIRYEENRRGFWIELLKNEVKTEFITILDSDDYLEPNYLDTLYNIAINNKSDIVICSSCFIFMKNGQIGYRKCNKDVLIQKNDIPEQFRVLYQFLRTTWGKLFNASLLNCVNIIDFKSIAYGGDTSIIFDFLSNMQGTIYLTNKILHNYRVHEKSVSYEYNPNRFYSDTFLFYKAEKFLESYGKISSENYEFLYLVYLNAVIDTVKVILGADISTNEKLSEVEKVLKDQLTQKMFKALSEHDSLKKFRKSIIEAILKCGSQYIEDRDILNKVSINLCLLNSNLDKNIISGSIVNHIKDDKFILTVSDFNHDILFEKNVLLRWIKNKNFILKYPDIIKAVYFGELTDALYKTIELLSEEHEISYEEELVLMCLNLSAALENADAFIYAKKLQAQLFLDQKRFVKAKEAIEDLIEMCSEDEDVIELKNRLEEEYE